MREAVEAAAERVTKRRARKQRIRDQQAQIDQEQRIDPEVRREGNDGEGKHGRFDLDYHPPIQTSTKVLSLKTNKTSDPITNLVVGIEKLSGIIKI
jgi:hypothetical protein